MTLILLFAFSAVPLLAVSGYGQAALLHFKPQITAHRRPPVPIPESSFGTVPGGFLGVASRPRGGSTVPNGLEERPSYHYSSRGVWIVTRGIPIEMPKIHRRNPDDNASSHFFSRCKSWFCVFWRCFCFVWNLFVCEYCNYDLNLDRDTICIVLNESSCWLDSFNYITYLKMLRFGIAKKVILIKIKIVNKHFFDVYKVGFIVQFFYDHYK